MVFSSRVCIFGILILNNKMLFIYTTLLKIITLVLPIGALFNKKLQLFVNGRKSVFEILKQNITASDKVLWFHAASLGEFEQGLPVMEYFKKNYPQYKIVLTFFSPSGFEIRKNNSVATVTVYLPLDTPKNAQKFIELVHPEMVFFIKYEYWLHYLNVLKHKNIKTYLISGIFRENQLFFKSYGGFYREVLQAFTYFFVQNQASENLLASLGYTNVLVSGDTRFDRVIGILNRDNSLEFIEKFKNNTPTIVLGSTWEDDEQLWLNFIKNLLQKVKFIIAPHSLNLEKIKELKERLAPKKVVLFSEKEGKYLADYDVFIIDTIGILTKIYSYATLAYVGGGFTKSGVHNVLEPAVFGLPIIIGPTFKKFEEAKDLVRLKGCISVDNESDLKQTVENLLNHPEKQQTQGNICKEYVFSNQNATEKIITTIEQLTNI